MIHWGLTSRCCRPPPISSMMTHWTGGGGRPASRSAASTSGRRTDAWVEVRGSGSPARRVPLASAGSRENASDVGRTAPHDQRLRRGAFDSTSVARVAGRSRSRGRIDMWSVHVATPQTARFCRGGFGAARARSCLRSGDSGARRLPAVRGATVPCVARENERCGDASLCRNASDIWLAISSSRRMDASGPILPTGLHYLLLERSRLGP